MGVVDRAAELVVLAIDALTAFSKTPLRVIGAMGVFLFFFAMLLGFYYLFSYVFHGVPVQGFTTLVVLTLLLHSVTFMFLGVLGEYLSRIFDDSKGRPRVIIAETTMGVSVGSPDAPRFL